MRITITKNVLIILLVLSDYGWGQHKIYFKSGSIMECNVILSSLDSAEVSYITRKKEYGKVSYDRLYFITSQDGKLIYPAYIVGNSSSKLFHYPSVKHAPDSSSQVIFKTINEAEERGYIACNACIDVRLQIPDYEFEISIVKKIKSSIQSQYEIVYEHPKLKLVQDALNDVLKFWPEALKGYKYRIQIYKDDEVNASALATGNLYISTGLLDIVEYPEELNGIIAHEIAHVERRHLLRQYFESQDQQAKSTLAAVISGIMVASITKNTVYTEAAMRLTKTMNDLADQVLMFGFSKELEQEADIMAQIYLLKAKKTSSSYVRMLDKLATQGMVRSGKSIGLESAYSNHPNIRARIHQIEHSKIVTYNEPLIISCAIKSKKLDSQSISLIFDYAYVAPVADPYGTVVFLLGSITNLTDYNSLRFADIEGSFDGVVEEFKVEGIESQIIAKNKSKEICAIIRHTTVNTPVNLLELITSKSIKIKSARLYTSNVDQGKRLNTSDLPSEIELEVSFVN